MDDNTLSQITICVTFENINRLIKSNGNSVYDIKTSINNDRKLSSFLGNAEYSITIFNSKFNMNIDLDDDDIVENEAKITISKV